MENIQFMIRESLVFSFEAIFNHFFFQNPNGNILKIVHVRIQISIYDRYLYLTNLNGLKQSYFQLDTLFIHKQVFTDFKSKNEIINTRLINKIYILQF